MDKHVARYAIYTTTVGIVSAIFTYIIIGVIFAPIGIEPDGEVMRRAASVLLGWFNAVMYSIWR